MKRGYVKLWRKTIDSPIFAHDGMFKLFCLCLTKASHKEIEITIPGILKPINLDPGQFITGRYSLWEDFHQINLKKRNRRKPAPATYSVWRWLLTLQDMHILSIKSYNKYSIITILNWHQYQENDHQVSIRRASSEHKQTQDKHKKETPDFFSLKKRYTNQKLIDQCFDALRSTRKNGKVKDSVLLAQLQKWDRYPVEQVESGIQVYLDKDYGGQGKREEYLLGIIRNQKNEYSKELKQDSVNYITSVNVEDLYR